MSEDIIVSNSEFKEKYNYDLATQVMKMLPTPQASDYVSTVREKDYSLRHLEHATGWAKNQMLPTPCATEAEKAGKGDKQNSLTRMVLRGEMLPTPVKSDFQPRWKTENWEGDSDLPSVINGILGTRSQLSPQFVMEMMGFQNDWTLLPFLNGEKSQSKPQETP